MRYFKKDQVFTFANGEKVPAKLRQDFLAMHRKVRKTKVTHSLVRINGKVLSLPSRGDPGINAVAAVTKALRGTFYGCIIVLG